MKKQNPSKSSSAKATPKRSKSTASEKELAKGSYHHGELPERLMALAVQAIEAEGTEALSLRALAREAGVSATAPYRHFPSKRCLFAGIATQGFLRLTSSMAAKLAEFDKIDDRFIAMGLAYIDFAVANPVHYKLMFGSVLADFSDYAMLQKAAEESYAQLLEQLSELIEIRQLAISPTELGGVVWSGVHGMASLMINNNSMVSAKSNSDQNRSLPGQSIGSLHMNTDRAMRVMFGNLIGDNAGLH